MNKQQQKSFNSKCAKLLGYIHYKKVDQDISDIGGIYEKTDIYSKIPIEVHEYDNDLVFFTDDWYKKARPSVNECLYIENPDFVNDWNQIEAILEQIYNLDFTLTITSSKTISKKFTSHTIIINNNNHNGIYIEKNNFTYKSECNNNETKKEAVIKILDYFLTWYDK